MKYNYKIMICKNGEWSELPVECQDVKAIAHSVNEHFGFQIVTRDTVYNYLQRPQVSNKRVFGKVVRIERSRAVPKRQRLRAEKAKALLDAKTQAQCNEESS